MQKQLKKQTGSNSKQKDAVSSKIEHTKLKGEGTTGLIQYRHSIKDMAKDIKKYALTLNDNLLSVKIALMEVVREVEEMMRERKGH